MHYAVGTHKSPVGIEPCRKNKGETGAVTGKLTGNLEIAGFPADLRQVINQWDTLPQHRKDMILRIVKTELIFDAKTYSITWADGTGKLQPQPYQCLEALWLAENHTIEKEALCEAIYFAEADDDYVRHLIYKLRKQLKQIGCPLIVATTRGKGYWIDTAGLATFDKADSPEGTIRTKANGYPRAMVIDCKQIGSNTLK
jgi:DNA-binding winged helix-turn-helix (wHTH) protein